MAHFNKELITQSKWAVVMEKQSTQMIRVRIPPRPTVFSVNFGI